MKWFSVLALLLVPISGSSNTITRPTFNPNTCICKDGSPKSYGNCAAFCIDKVTNGSEILFANLQISRSAWYKTTQQWCHRGLRSPTCVLTARDDSGNVTSLEVNFAQPNMIKVNVDQLKYDQSLVLSLIKTTTNISSDTVQIIKFEN